MRNTALQELDVLVGEWTLTMSDAWFLEERDTEVHGRAVIEWFGDAFVVMRSEMGGNPVWDLAIGRSDAHDAYTALYHDDRGTSRVFHMAFQNGCWTLLRQDPDFHQRFVGDVGPDRIAGRWEASEDEGRTWRKDFDLVFERLSPGQ